MKKKTRVLIVDDSALIRNLFTEMLSSDPEIEVIGTAQDPYDAREKIKQLNPDVVTLDVEMPKMDGISFLEKIMTLRPMPVVMASTQTQKGAETTLRALEIGAVDYVSKPTSAQTRNTLSLLKDELIHKVKVAATAHIRGGKVVVSNNNMPLVPPPLPYTPSAAALKKIIAIGSSTGGVEALREIITVLPANCPPIVITQHMPEAFTASFAARLSKFSTITVHEAEDNQKILPGNAYIAKGGKHLEIKSVAGAYYCRVSEGPLVSGHKPSVDVLFKSVADIAKDKVVGIILTGMGKDGAEGMLEMKKAGAQTIGQNEESCVVYGMPKAAMQLGAIDVELSLGKIAEELLKRSNA